MASSPGPKKLRIYEVAKDLGMSSDVVIQISRKLGVEVKNHMSTLPADMVEKVRAEMATEKAAAREVVVRQQEQEAAQGQQAIDAAPAMAAMAKTAMGAQKQQ